MTEIAARRRPLPDSSTRRPLSASSTRRPLAPTPPTSPSTRRRLAPSAGSADPVGGAAPLRTRGSAAPAVAPSPAQPAPGRTEAARHLRIVQSPERSAAARRRRVRGGVILGSVLIMLVCFGLVYLHVLSAQKQFALDTLSTREQKAQATYQGLRLRVEDDNSPARVMRAALALGMVQPGSITWVQAAPGGAVQPLAAPTAASGTTAPAGVANWPTDKADVAGDP